MAYKSSEEEINQLVTAFFQGQITRRRFIRCAARVGLSAALLHRIAPASFAAADSFLESSPVASNESPITQERVAYLQSKPYANTTINIMVLRSAVGDCVEYHAPRWEEETGAHVNITKVPIDTLHDEIFSDIDGPGQYDAYQTAAWFYGDFFTSEDPKIVEIAPLLKEAKFPYWDPDQFLPAMKRLYTWRGKLYGVLFDADAQILYYRKDVLGNLEFQDKFKGKMGYDLPNPPQSMKEMHDVATFFTGWDWNGDGKDDWGISLHAKVNEQGFFHFLTLAAPYVISPNNKHFYFNPEDMKPLINSEGHLRALEDYRKFLTNGPKEQIGWTLNQGWNLFLAGHAVLEPTWGDLPTFAQDRAHSSVQGRIGSTTIPGTDAAFNPVTGHWENYSLNRVGNTNGGSWHCVISNKSKQKEATYDFLAFMANKKNAFFNSTNGWTGVQPAMKYEYFPPVGTATIEAWEAQGWDKDDAIGYLGAYYSNLVLTEQEIYLRIPGAAEYWHELDVRISAVLSGEKDSKSALDDIHQKWEQITERHGREKQKKLYAESFGE
ncbi:MAG: extracellular solute-binding protein [Verrucomicrobia bacterium]|nr:extracellular solute-binding protein [Verrucomicrobiota bacterium]